MTRQDRARWEARYAGRDPQAYPEASPLLARFAQHLPESGLALDVACGMGQNALWLAERGLRVLAVDFSLIALRRGLSEARARHLAGRVTFVRADLDAFWLTPGAFDVVTVFLFLDRKLFPALRAALRPGGLVIYQGRNWRRLRADPTANPAHLLRPGELERAFTDWEVLAGGDVADRTHVVARKVADG
jgi:tellurite methyltransferase